MLVFIGLNINHVLKLAMLAHVCRILFKFWIILQFVMRSCLCSVVNWTVQCGKETRKSCFLLCGEEQMKWLPPYLVHDFSTCNKRGHDPPKTVLRSKKMWRIAMNCGELRWMRQIAANCRELRRIGDSLLRKFFGAANELRRIAVNAENLRFSA